MSEINITLYGYNRSKGVYEVDGKQLKEDEIDMGWWKPVQNAIITQPGCLKVDNEFMLIYAVKS